MNNSDDQCIPNESDDINRNSGYEKSKVKALSINHDLSRFILRCLSLLLAWIKIARTDSQHHPFTNCLL